MRSIFTDPPKRGTKFVALFGDGSGGNIFWKTAARGIIDHENNPLPKDYLQEAGYAYWLPLSDKFKLWFEFKE